MTEIFVRPASWRGGPGARNRTPWKARPPGTSSHSLESQAPGDGCHTDLCVLRPSLADKAEVAKSKVPSESTQLRSLTSASVAIVRATLCMLG